MSRTVSAWIAGLSLAVSYGLALPASSNTEGTLAGGETTVFDATRNAFSLPARNLLEEHRPDFFVGNSFFNQNWVIAPASVTARDGLGPLFNARSCSGCHFKDGRGRPPDSGQPIESMLIRISVPGTGTHGEPRPDPIYGDQIQGLAIPGVPAEADVFVRYEEIPGTLPDGERYSLRRPTYEIRNLGYGPMAPGLLISPRVAPGMIGLGLLEAIPEATLTALADPDDVDGDGVSGRLNTVWDAVASTKAIGRFGWKAEQPTVEQQAAGAFAGDIGITSRLHAEDNHTAAEQAARQRPSGGSPELSDERLRAVALYSRSLAVPAARTGDSPTAVRGRQIFTQAGCAACHRTELRTSAAPEFAEFARQVINPYTDLLLHDMGPGLADNRPVFAANSREWRTPPLWGLGLISKVNAHTFLLHDGRARNSFEAILWHGGEAGRSVDRFKTLPRDDRKALLAFLDSL